MRHATRPSGLDARVVFGPTRTFDPSLASDGLRAVQVIDMTAQPATECGTDWTAVVAVRVPRDGTGDLATNASRRLAAGADVEAADVIELCALEPGLAATIARLEVRVRGAGDLDAGAMRRRLAAAPGVERVDELHPA